MILTNQQKIGITATLIFHLLLLFIFLFYGLSYLDPPPPEKGITITFGTDNAGKPEKEISKPKPQPQKPVSKPVKEVQKEIISQKTNETVQIEKKTKPKKKISKDLSKALNALNQKKETVKIASKGNTNKSGNQGGKSGDINSENFKGSGNGNGIKFSLKGRSLSSFKRPINDTQESGIVVVDITVDGSGKVIKAIPGGRGSTTTSKTLYKKATDAALKARFNNSKSSDLQKGEITFIFILN